MTQLPRRGSGGRAMMLDTHVRWSSASIDRPSSTSSGTQRLPRRPVPRCGARALSRAGSSARERGSTASVGLALNNKYPLTKIGVRLRQPRGFRRDRGRPRRPPSGGALGRAHPRRCGAGGAEDASRSSAPSPAIANASPARDPVPASFAVARPRRGFWPERSFAEGATKRPSSPGAS